jgi:hypothetical protein
VKIALIYFGKEGKPKRPQLMKVQWVFSKRFFFDYTHWWRLCRPNVDDIFLEIDSTAVNSKSLALLVKIIKVLEDSVVDKFLPALQDYDHLSGQAVLRDCVIQQLGPVQFL